MSRGVKAERAGTPASDSGGSLAGGKRGRKGSVDDSERGGGNGSGGEEGGKPSQQERGSKRDQKASTSGGGGADQTDLHALDDVAGIAGVDLQAEEEAIRASHQHTRTQQQQAAARARVKPQLILDEQALKDAVLRIAASFQLKNLESDSLPLIGLAVQMRLRELIEAMIQAKQHRISSNHLRPPPMYPVNTGSDGELPAPMWDQVLYDDVEKILGTIDRVEREEERQARKDRLARDTAEQEERERLARLAEEQAENGGAGFEGAFAGPSGTSGDTSMNGAGSVPGTPLSASTSERKALGSSIGPGTGTGGEKKRKRETPAQTARNMSDDVRKKLSDQTAMRTLGTKKRYSWMSGGGGGMDSPLGNKKNLPKPKFPPLPPSSLSIATSADSPSGKRSGSLAGMGDEEDSKGETVSSGLHSGLPQSAALARLNAVSRPHEASKLSYGGNSMLEDPGNKYITIRDAIFVLENERGKGSGVGSGTKAVFKAHMGRMS